MGGSEEGEAGERERERREDHAFKLHVLNHPGRERKTQSSRLLQERAQGEDGVGLSLCPSVSPSREERGGHTGTLELPLPAYSAQSPSSNPSMLAGPDSGPGHRRSQED